MSTQSITANAPTPVHEMFLLQKKKYKMNNGQLITELNEDSYKRKSK